eukprot:gene11983-13897_t
MLNQVFSMIFGNSESDLHSKATRQAPFNSDNKKRSATEMEESAAMSEQLGASDSDVSPTKKRGRPPLKKNIKSNMKKSVNKGHIEHNSDRESDNESSDADVDRGTKRTRSTRSSLVMPSNTSDYDGSEEEDSEEEETPVVTTVRRSSRSAVLNATQQTPIAPVQRSSSETSAFSSYLSSALMRRSRRSRTVDLTKPLVVMLPGDDPREVTQLDLRGDVEWEEFLLAMSEDTTFMTSDNEDGPSDHQHLPHSSSVLSLSGLVGGADGPPSRSRNSSNSFSVTSPLPAADTKSSKNASMKKGKLDEKQVQYNEVMSVNVAATLSEVFVPEVKESELFKVITAINLVNEANKSTSSASSTTLLSLQTPASSTTTSKVRARARDGALHELAQQVLVDKRCGGYDDATNMFIMPEHLRHTSEMYVDYDADSDDEQFVRDLQIKLSRPRTPRHSTTSPAASKKTPVDTNIVFSDSEVVLKVRCLELMIARLEREFELARQFSAEPLQSTRATATTTTTASKVTSTKDSTGVVGSSSALPVRQTIAAQLAATLEQAQASYELAKRFLKQPPVSQGTRKANKSPVRSSGKATD